jgi:hydroxymethylpyrimidine/phosphomethylpyrimidine kinase
MTPPRVLIVAGSDSGGGAGIQADIKTVTMLGGFAMTAITAVTAQNSLGVDRILPLPLDMVDAQFGAVVADLGVDAVKIGMLGTAGLVRTVADCLATLPRDVPVVLDPVMIATSGSALNEAGTAEALAALAPYATLVTPNLAELRALTGLGVTGEASMALAAGKLAERFGCPVLAKGGHLPGDELVDLLVTAAGIRERWPGARIHSQSTHGTGCTLASGIATGLGARLKLEDAIAQARLYVRAAITAAPGFGGGHGPVGHALGIVPFDLVRGRKG